MPDNRLRRLLRHRSLMSFWVARVGATTGAQMLMVAVGWQIYDLTHSAWDLGLVGLFQFLPALLLTLPAGHVADRLPRTRIIAACLLAQATAGTVLTFATFAGAVTPQLIFAISIVLGVCRAFQMPAQQALLPLLVEPELVAPAIALAASGMQTAIICGPALGGLIYMAGPGQVYGTCAVIFALAFALMASVRARQHPVPGASNLKEVFAGVDFLWRNKILLGATTLDLFAVLLGGATALLPMFARDLLHVGPQGLGFLRAAPAAGALLMSLVLLRWPVDRHAGRWLLASVAVYGAATLAFGASTHYWLSMTALAITGAADNISVVIRQTLVQLETPDAIRGRVSAVNSIFIGASNQLGEFESGATAAWLGPVGSVLLGGAGTIMIALVWRRAFPLLARRDRLVS